jgi:hypothetical protein
MNPSLKLFLLPGPGADQELRAAPVPTLLDFHPPTSTTNQGSTAHFTVLSDNSLGSFVKAIAAAVLKKCEADYSTIWNYFGGVTPTGFQVVLTTGIGGALHYGCQDTTLYCDTYNPATFLTATAFTQMLVIAELVEVFEAMQGRGWDCGRTNGEALSRALAAALYPNSATGAPAIASHCLSDKGGPDP